MNCYANRLALRLQAIGQPNYRNGFKVTLHPHTLEITLGVEKAPNDFRQFDERPFSSRGSAPIHSERVLNNARSTLASLPGAHKKARACKEPRYGTQNIWMGVSIESPDYVFRIDHLRATHAHVKFLSLEPLLGPLSILDLRAIDWVIVGGESGPGARPMDPGWVRE